ncbi:MAG: hypothetical protein RLO17_13305 [Cyclobacteriaceae bacterium]
MEAGSGSLEGVGNYFVACEPRVLVYRVVCGPQTTGVDGGLRAKGSWQWQLAGFN